MELADLSDDHVELHAVIGRAERALPDFARDPATGAAAFGAVMTEMADLLDEHIAEEEREVFPVIRDARLGAGLRPLRASCSGRGRRSASWCSCCPGWPTSAPPRSGPSC